MREKKTEIYIKKNIYVQIKNKNKPKTAKN